MALSEKLPTDIYREQLKCGFEQIDAVFADCMDEACNVLSKQGIKTYLDGASLICMIGRGVEPVLVYLEEMPQMASILGEEILEIGSQSVWKMSRTPNGKAILPFLQSLPATARRLSSLEQMQHYLDLVCEFAEQTTGSIHGFQTTIPSPGLPEFLNNVPYLLSQLSIVGLKNWIDYGVRNYNNHPERQKDFFSLQSADSKAMLQRERHGTLYADNERKLDMYLKGLWATKTYFVPYSTGFDELRKPIPYFDKLGLRIPDVYDDKNDVAGIDRYRAILAHYAAHEKYSGTIVADNLSPFQRIAVEIFEDSRVEYLAIKQYPGLKNLWIKLHPIPIEDDCIIEKESCIRHRLAMLSYAILNPKHPYKTPVILEYVDKFKQALNKGQSSTKAMVDLAISFIAKTRRQTDLAANVYFKDTEVEYRDDNRHLWIFIEEGDEEEAFESDEQKPAAEDESEQTLPPRHYHEWDYHTQSYKPDWVSLYESLHPQADASDIDKILKKHELLAKRLKQILELLKPQNYVRVRYQEEGSELDLDVAIRSIIDFKCGTNPDPRINMDHQHDGRNIAVMLLLDLSESLNEIPKGSKQSILDLSKEAVSLLGWAIEKLGDNFAIAGFSSNTRHEVRYQHIKGYSEQWGDDVKARLAAIQAGYSTRMGAAMRHAGHYLSTQKADKKLLLILTDGEPADIDVNDEQLLRQDARKATLELNQKGIYSYCISLDTKADEYITDIFGNHYSVIDHIDRLPEKLPQLFLALTS